MSGTRKTPAPGAFCFSHEAPREEELRAALYAAVAGYERAFAWGAGAIFGHAFELHVVPMDALGRVARDAVLPFGSLQVHIPAGSIATPGERAHVLRGADRPITVQGRADVSTSLGSLTIAVAGSDAGTVSFEAEVPSALLDASIRYSYCMGPSDDPAGGFQYPVFQTNSARVAVEARFDPSRSLDPDANEIRIVTGGPLPTCFRTPLGETLSLQSRAGAGITPQWDPVSKTAYFTPQGDWEIVPPSSSAPCDVMLGLSGIEYARAPSGSALRFVAGSPALAQRPAAPGATFALTAGTSPQHPVTTSWIYFLAPVEKQDPVFGYYAQPDENCLFVVADGDALLEAREVRVAGFPEGSGVFQSPSASFPAVPYAAATPTVAPTDEADEADEADEDWLDALAQFESDVISPARSVVLQALNAPSHSRRAASGGATLAVTPQGMLSTFSEDFSSWESLVLAQGSASTLVLNEIADALRMALLSNHLFLVITDIKAFQKLCTLSDPFNLFISDWIFDLSADQWVSDTVLIIKAGGRDLVDAVADVSYWTMAETFNEDPARASKSLVEIIASSSDTGGLGAALRGWNGVLCFNCSVPASNFPPELEGLAAGIHEGALTAHHIGVSLAPVVVSDGVIQLANASLFGAIDYETSTDLMYTGVPYAFQVRTLRVAFENSQIVSFSSRIELLVAELFGETALLDGTQGGLLWLDGTWQKHGDQNTYAFTFAGESLFGVMSDVVQNVTVSAAQFATLPTTTKGDVTARFALEGAMRFHPLDLDVFSFGIEPDATATATDPGLSFANLQITMSFTESDPNAATFDFQAGQMVLSTANDSARDHGLYGKFPLRARAMLQGAGTLPGDLGYMPVSTVLQMGSLGATWFGLELALNFGSAGGLAAVTNFTGSLLLAWAPPGANQNYNVFVGLRLPGSHSGKKSLSIEGPLTLDIGDISLLYNENEQGYLMKLSRLALGVFGVHFPYGGQNNLLLFGDPNPERKSTSLGWYFAYKSDDNVAPPPRQ